MRRAPCSATSPRVTTVDHPRDDDRPARHRRRHVPRPRAAGSARVLGVRLLWGGFEDGSVPSGPEAITVIDRVVEDSQAEVMYTHAAADTHQDHRSTAIASQAAARRIGSVLCYETPSSQGFEPNVFVEIDDVLDAKLAALRAHWSQVLRSGPVDLEAITAQARFRGFQGRVQHAEAFESNRFVWDLGTAPTRLDLRVAAGRRSRDERPGTGRALDPAGLRRRRADRLSALVGERSRRQRRRLGRSRRCSCCSSSDISRSRHRHSRARHSTCASARRVRLGVPTTRHGARPVPQRGAGRRGHGARRSCASTTRTSSSS